MSQYSRRRQTPRIPGMCRDGESEACVPVSQGDCEQAIGLDDNAHVDEEIWDYEPLTITSDTAEILLSYCWIGELLVWSFLWYAIAFALMHTELLFIPFWVFLGLVLIWAKYSDDEE